MCAARINKQRSGFSTGRMKEQETRLARGRTENQDWRLHLSEHHAGVAWDIHE